MDSWNICKASYPKGTNCGHQGSLKEKKIGHPFADSDEDAIVETGPFAKLSTAGAIRLLANYCHWCPIFFSLKHP